MKNIKMTLLSIGVIAVLATGCTKKVDEPTTASQPASEPTASATASQ